MKKEILSEVNRYREIMGLSLLLENGGISLLGSGRNSISALSSISDDLTGILKNTDELMDLADDAAILSEYPVLREIKTYLVDQEISLGRALEPTDITQLNKVDDLILDYFSTYDAMEAGTRFAFIESYLEKSGLGKVKNTTQINDSFYEASALGLRELKGLKDVLKREVSASTNLPRYMKDLVIADIEGVAKNWEKPSLKNKKFKMSINKSYDDFIDSSIAGSTISSEQLKQFIPKKTVDMFKERLIANNGDINKTVTQLNLKLNEMISKIEETTGKTRAEIFKEMAEEQGSNFDAIFGFGPFKSSYEKIKNGKNPGETLWGTISYGLIATFLGVLAYVGLNWSEVGDSTGFWGPKLSTEGASLKRKFSNITKVNKFWNEVAVYVTASGKIGDVLGANAIAKEEQIEDSIKSEDKFKVTFNFGDFGTMVWITDNEGEEPLYDYGSGVFPKNAMDIPDVPNNDTSNNDTNIKAPSIAEFQKWIAETWKDYPDQVALINAATPVINGNDVTVTIEGYNPLIYTKTGENSFVAKK